MKRSTFILVALFVLILPGPRVEAATMLRVSDPVSIEIRSIHIVATIEARGTTPAGVMLPPTSAWRVSWFRDGVRPGQPGNAVMYGHLNTTTSRVAIFSNLRRLRVDNIIRVTDRTGTVRLFKVKKIRRYRREQLPIQEILGPTKEIHLNLYTCAGTWNGWLGDYSHRLVVFTSLISTLPSTKLASS